MSAEVRRQANEGELPTMMNEAEESTLSELFSFIPYMSYNVNVHEAASASDSALSANDTGG